MLFNGNISINLDIISKAYEELAEAETSEEEDVYQCASFVHVRLSPQRAAYYSKRVQTLVDDLLHEKPDPEGRVYGVVVSMFASPAYMQSLTTLTPVESNDTDKPEQ